MKLKELADQSYSDDEFTSSDEEMPEEPKLDFDALPLRYLNRAIVFIGPLAASFLSKDLIFSKTNYSKSSKYEVYSCESWQALIFIVAGCKDAHFLVDDIYGVVQRAKLDHVTVMDSKRLKSTQRVCYLKTSAKKFLTVKGLNVLDNCHLHEGLGAGIMTRCEIDKVPAIILICLYDGLADPLTCEVDWTGIRDKLAKCNLLPAVTALPNEKYRKDCYKVLQGNRSRLDEQMYI